MRTALLALALPLALPLLGCAGGASYVRSDAALGRVVVYRNGVAYFERHARVDGDTLRLSVPADKVDDFLKSLTVVDARTGEPAPVAYPTSAQSSDSGLVDMQIHLPGPSPHDLRISYVTEAPSWKPSYRVLLEKGGKVRVEAWAIVDNTSGEDWKDVKLGVGSSSALSFRYDLRSIRAVARQSLRADDLFAQAPPTGGVTHGGLAATGGSALAFELTDDALASDADRAPRGGSKKDVSQKELDRRMERHRAAAPVTVSEAGPPPAPPAQGAAGTAPATGGLSAVAQALVASDKHVVVEGYADPSDPDPRGASLARATRARAELLARGVPADRVVAVGKGARPGQHAGVRIAEAEPTAPADEQGSPPDDAAAEPVGTSSFESDAPLSVARGTSAMVSILHDDTEGQVVYYYDPDGPRGNATFPFRSVRIRNPTDSVLESGPVTVFGDGRFVGEGICEPIPAHAVAFVPFSLDRQIVVDRKDAERDAIARIVSVQRGVLSAELRHTRRTALTLTNRASEPATVYVRHEVPAGFELTQAPADRERLGRAELFRVEVPASGKKELVIEEATPVQRSTDLRTDEGIALVKAYVEAAPSEAPLRDRIAALVRDREAVANLEQRIATTREQMTEYRARMDELHAQIVTLHAVRGGQALVDDLESKMREVSARVSQATLEVVGLEDQLLLAKIRYEEGISELSLDPRPPAAPAASTPGAGGASSG